jgi:hypothetical protein
MADFSENMRLKGKAEEDLYFAELDRKLIDALHKKQDHAHYTDEEDDGIGFLSPSKE